MPDRIPPEAQAQIDAFKATDSGWQKKERTERQLDIPKRGNTADVERLAGLLGFIVTGGGGNHGKHVETAGGKFVCSLPAHGGSGELATGTWLSILRSLGLK